MDAKDTAYLKWLEKEYFSDTDVMQKHQRPHVPPAPHEQPTIHLLVEPVPVHVGGFPWIYTGPPSRRMLMFYKWILASSSLLALGALGFYLLWDAFK